MKKAVLIIVLFVGISMDSLAQQDPSFSQFMLNKSYWSPALVGIDGEANVRLFSRIQWAGYSSSFQGDGLAPVTQFLSFETPFSVKKLDFGLGVNLIHDQLGVQTNNIAQISLSFHKKLRKGKLSFAVRPEFISQRIDSEKWIFVDQEDPFANVSSESMSVFDLGAGISFSNPSLVVGIGVNHLMRPDFNFVFIPDGTTEGKKIAANVYAEYNYRVTYNIDLRPSLLVSSNINATSIDLGVIAAYNKKIWGGLSYRNSEAIVILMGASFLKNEKLKVGYSFDYVVHDQEAKEPTSHEWFLKYNLPSFSKGDKKIIRTPRFRY